MGGLNRALQWLQSYETRRASDHFQRFRNLDYISLSHWATQHTSVFSAGPGCEGGHRSLHQFRDDDSDPSSEPWYVDLMAFQPAEIPIDEELPEAT